MDGSGDRYGAEHRRLRKATAAQAVGQLCARCFELIRHGDAVDLDHADERNGYLGYSHRSCNRSAGASHGNRLRAEAYRAAKRIPPTGSTTLARQRQQPGALCPLVGMPRDRTQPGNCACPLARPGCW